MCYPDKRLGRTDTKIGNTSHVRYNNDGISVGWGEAEIEMGQKVDRIVAVALREPSFYDIWCILQIFDGKKWFHFKEVTHFDPLKISTSISLASLAFGWIAYTVSRSERKDSPEDPWRLFRYDQTHILTIIASYKLPWWKLEVGIRFRYVTGNPTTPVVGGLRDTTSQDWLQISGGINSNRLPAFQQLDLRIDKTWVFNRWRLGLYLDIQNLYNYSNSEATVYGGRQLYQSAGITGIPFFPNIGLRADF